MDAAPTSQGISRLHYSSDYQFTGGVANRNTYTYLAVFSDTGGADARHPFTYPHISPNTYADTHASDVDSTDAQPNL